MSLVQHIVWTDVSNTYTDSTDFIHGLLKIRVYHHGDDGYDEFIVEGRFQASFNGEIRLLNNKLADQVFSNASYIEVHAYGVIH